MPALQNSERRTDRQTDKWKDGQTDRQMEGRTDRQTNGRTDIKKLRGAFRDYANTQKD